MLSMFTRQESQPAPKAKAAAAPALRLLRDTPPANPANANPSPAPLRKKGAEARTPSIGQYLYHLQHDLKSYVRAETLNAVIGATPAEVQRVARIAAKLKGRYLATLMDLGTGEKGPVGEAEIRDLRRSREMYEEVELGLAKLREALEAGDLELDGVRAD